MARRFLGDFEVTNNVLIGNTLTLSALTVSRALEIDGSGNVVSSSVTSTEMGYLAGVTSDIQTQLDAKQNTSEKGNANGYASLDSGGKIPTAQLPNSVMEFQGGWNASTNTPTLIDGTGNAGDVYRASVAGSQDLGSGSQSWSIGDLVMYSGSIWEKAPASDAVSSVFGRTGAVAAASSDYDAVQIDYDNSSSSLTASDVQAAIDEVESRLDSAESNITANDGDITDIRSAVGIADGATSMGTFTGSTISDNVSAKVGMQELETSLELKAASSVVTEIDANVDDLITLSGVAENSTDLGTFTGSIIADASTNKAALQSLETEVELKAASTDLASTANGLGSSLIGVEDSAANFTGTDLESVLAELASSIAAGTDDQVASEVPFEPGLANSNPELLSNGDFASGDATSWDTSNTAGGAVDYSGFSANHDDTGALFNWQSFATESGKTYTVQMNLKSHSGAVMYISARDGATYTGQTVVNSMSANTVGYHSFTFTATSANSLITHQQGSGSFGETDDISVKLEYAGSGLVSTDVQGAIDELEPRVYENEQDIADIRTLSGTADESTDLGTFTGSIISDSGTIKAGMQELETEVELKAASSDLASNANALGASLIGIEDASSQFTGTNVEAALDEALDAAQAAQSDIDDHKDGGVSKHDGSEVDYERVDGSKKSIQAASDDVEAAISDLDDFKAASSDLASTANALGASLIGVEDSAANFTATNLEAVLAELQTNIDAGTDDQTAAEVSYSNATSGLTATDVQAAIDEVEGRLDTEESSLSGHLDGGASKHDASEVDYERSDGSKIDIQAASDDVESALSDLDDNKMSKSSGDLAEASFSGANNQVSAASVTGLAFAAGVVRSFRVHGSIVIDATADLYEEFELYGIQRGSDFQMDDMRTGDNSGVVFSITAAGQVQYTSPNSAGFVSLDIKFRAITTSV